MIRRLRIKFICVIMAVVMVLLGCILGIVIHFTGKSMQMQSINMMRTIATSPFQGQKLPGKPMDDQVRLPFFTVQISSNGELTWSQGGYFDLSDEAYVRQIVEAAMHSEGETGTLQEQDLRYFKAMNPRGFTIVFADTTTEAATLKNLVYSCLGIFLVTMVVFLGISVLLSHWAIKPVATAWDQQRQFVADASHELKTPLSIIMANAELLQGEDADAQAQKQYAANILGVTYQMRSLVENMLEMARVDNGSLKMPTADVDFSQLAEDAVLSFQLLYEEKGLQLQYSVQEGIHVSGSEQHLYQVLDVLLDNAQKYSRNGNLVRVALTNTGRHCLLRVDSPGDPISQEDLKNIFKRFYRVDKARTMDGSYGLGLSIAEAIVHGHKGKIWAESKDGSNAFFVQLPLRG